MAQCALLLMSSGTPTGSLRVDTADCAHCDKVMVCADHLTLGRLLELCHAAEMIGLGQRVVRLSLSHHPSL
jgi:hypothetical protein